jgi:2,4-dienoyl-CoA reductase-like NADH-dependent reductase (Old Yellow Enzyme family)
MSKSIAFTKSKLGPLTLKNRIIRSAAFEGMCPNGIPSDSLYKYHKAVAEGGVGMTTVAYMAVSNNGRAFNHECWMNDDIIPHLKKLTAIIKKAGAKSSVQLGHCGNMADKKVSGDRVLAPTRKFNLFSFTMTEEMTEKDISDIINAYGNSVSIAMKSGFDAVEIHAGHGYLISQFLSPITNERTDRWGGSLENRYRFLHEVIKEVKKKAGKKIAVIVKMNLRDAVPGGIEIEDSIKIAKRLEKDGVDALVLSGGFVSRNPMYLMRGNTPFKELAHYQTKGLFVKLGLLLAGRFFMKSYKYEDLYFFEDSKKIRNIVKIPVIYVGGAASLKSIEKVIKNGFNFVQIGRALIYETDFVKRIEKEPEYISGCVKTGPCNECMAAIYSGEAKCYYKIRNGI